MLICIFYNHFWISSYFTTLKIVRLDDTHNSTALGFGRKKKLIHAAYKYFKGLKETNFFSDVSKMFSRYLNDFILLYFFKTTRHFFIFMHYIHLLDKY